MKRNLPLLLATTRLRQLYLPTKIRIRQWGTLPGRRGPTVLIANHQHVDEGEIVFSRAFLRHPRIPIVAVNSRRTFEGGFFATQWPWTAPLTRRMNVTRLWTSLGLLPIENHLHSRPLISFAEEIVARHGDLVIDEIVSTDVLRALGLWNRRLADLWAPAFFASAHKAIKLGDLRQPYRREAIECLRATVARDIAAVVETVQAGATLYITPEGDFSHDGRMHPLRNGITDAVLPVAEAWLCAIAYDPFRGRRLSMLYRITKPADRNDLGLSLAAARPVTTSALLAAFLCRVRTSFVAEEAKDAVRSQLDTLPTSVFVDPELLHSIDSAVIEALTVLSAHGVLATDGFRYRLTGHAGDARFPHVKNMLTFQGNMHAETVAAATRLSWTSMNEGA